MQYRDLVRTASKASMRNVGVMHDRISVDRSINTGES
jgi:hypothetical protein